MKRFFIAACAKNLGTMNARFLLILLLTSIALSKTNAQAPVNDDCSGAIVINTTPFGTACSTSVFASTLTATPSLPGTTCVASPDDDLWYQFTPATSTVIFRYANARNIVTGSQTSPSFALYANSCPTTTASFLCVSVTVSGNGFRIINGLTPGVTYYLRLWSLSAGIGMAIDFCIQDVAGPPANDNCAGAQAVSTLPPGSTCTSPILASTVGSTQSTPAPSCSSTSHNDDIWYSFVANTDAVSIQFSNARLATTNGNANLGYAVYNTPCPTTTATLQCNGNLGGNSGSVTLSNLSPGQTYYIRFFSLGDNNYMTFNFCLVDVIVANNDECTSALTLRTYNFGEIFIPARASTAGGTRSANDPDCGANENNDDVWYKFTASTASIVLGLKNVVVNETGGGGTAGFALYEGSCPTSATTFACNTIGSAGAGEHIINGLTPGAEYYLRLWSTLTGGNTVSVSIYVLNIPAVANDECINATPITTQTSDSLCNSTIHASTAGATKSTPDPSCANGFHDEDIWYSFVASSNAVRINFSNAGSIAGGGSGTLGFALHNGSCATLPRTLGCQANFGTGSGTALVSGLVPGETYLLRFFSYDVNNYIEFDFCVVNTSLPPNDECADATSILVGNGFCTSPRIGTLRNATAAAGFGAPSCAPGATSQDVWFSTSVPASGNLVIQTSVLGNNAAEDLVMEVYTGTCEALTLLACDDDGNPEASPNQWHSRVSLTGRDPGQLLYIRIMRKFPLAYGDFAICAWDSTALVPIADGGNCVPSGTLFIDSASANNNMWVPVMDGSKHIIAEINARGSNLGAIDASLFVNTSGTVRNVNGHYYLDRNLSIVPQTSGAARIRLYIKNNEWQALQAADPTVLSLRNLKISKTSAACGPIFTGPGTTIMQDSSGNYGADHFVEFSIPSFSSFFVDGGQSALPLEFVSFRAEKKNDHIALDWTVVQDETIHKFDVQRSDNGISFIDVGEQAKNQYISAVNNSWQYHFTDKAPASGQVYYRIKMSDVNGKQLHSKVVALNAGPAYTGALSVYPNPVSKQLIIRMPVSVTGASLTLYNGAGIVVKQLTRQAIANGILTLDMQAQPAGVYILQVSDGRQQFQFKVIKQ